MKLPKESDDKYVVEAVVKALDVLEVFQDGEELQLSEISKRVSLNKSRAFRLLSRCVSVVTSNAHPTGTAISLGLSSSSTLPICAAI